MFNSQFATRNFTIKTCNLPFHWNLQPLTRYTLLRNLPCSATNHLRVETVRIYVALNTSGVTWTIVREISKSFDGIKHTTGLLHKINFYCVYGKIFFLTDSYLSSGRLLVASKCKPSSKYAINSGMRQNYILIHLYFFYLICLPDYFLCKMILLSTHHGTNHLTCRNKLK